MRRTLRPLPILVLIVLLLGSVLGGARAQVSSEGRALARQILEDLLRAGVPGAAAAVSVEGKVVFSDAVGLADLEQNVAATPRTRFRIGSVSKPMATAALGRMFERGEIGPDDAVAKHVPEWGATGGAMTIRHLAGHLAGIRHYKGQEFSALNRSFATSLEALEIFRADPLLSAPGEAFHYSTYGYTLLSAAMERAAKKDFLRLMQEDVFAPLKLAETSADRSSALIAGRTRFYELDAKTKKPRNAPAVDASYKWAGGGFLSTPEDLLRFGEAFLEPGYLKAETLALLLTSLTNAKGERTGYGFGWMTGKGEGESSRIAHGGGSVGGTTKLLVDRKRRIVVAVCSNLTGAPLDKIDERLMKALVPVAEPAAAPK